MDVKTFIFGFVVVLLLMAGFLIGMDKHFKHRCLVKKGWLEKGIVVEPGFTQSEIDLCETYGIYIGQ